MLISRKIETCQAYLILYITLTLCKTECRFCIIMQNEYGPLRKARLHVVNLKN
jgi:hypothetical protein